MAPPLRLISHDLCPYVQRAAIALTERGVPFERITISLAAKPDWFTAISPLGKVPLLRVPNPDGAEAVLFESNVICEWIEETQPGPRLHPEDPFDRARHRAWMEFGSVILSDIWGFETTQERTIFEAKRNALVAKCAHVEAALGAKPFFEGERFSLVDAVFGPVFRYFHTFDAICELGIFAITPKVRAWRAALAARPSIRDAVGSDYAELLHAFLVRHDAYILKAAA